MADAIKVENITKVDVNSTALPSTSDTEAIFDRLMKAAMLHAKQEWDAGRIKGAEWATVYLGIMQTVIAQSVQYALTEPKVEKEIELLEAQKSEVEAGTNRQDGLVLRQQMKIEKDIETEDTDRHNNAVKMQATLDADYGYTHTVIDATTDEITLGAREDSGTVYQKEETSKHAIIRADEDHEKELLQKDAQRQVTLTNKNKIGKEVLMSEMQRLKMIEQVNDNKLIKAIGTLGDIISLSIGKDIRVSNNVWGEFFGLLGDLTESVRSGDGKINASDVKSGKVVMTIESDDSDGDS